VRISIFGMGYVGAVSAACLSRDGHEVLGCDVDPAKLELIRRGATPIIEEGMRELVADGVKSGRLRMTDNALEAIEQTDLSFICVGTPALPNGAQGLEAIRRVSTELGQAIRSGSSRHTFVVRSTVFPGTIDEVVRPLLEQSSGKRSQADFDLCFQPEFLREGSSIRDYDNPPFTLVGVESEQPATVLKTLFGHLPCDFLTTGIRTAEMLKYVCNAFHALKITFANEVGRICQAVDVPSHEVMDLVCRDTRLNISPAYLKPGFAFGGSCLPKDMRALLHGARRRDVDVPVLSGVLSSNALHVERAVETVLSTGKKSVGMIGLSFKSGTDDLRESPLVTMAERFIGKGLDLKIYDPSVQVARLVGANRRYIEESIPHISSLMTTNCEEIVRHSDVVIVGMRDDPLLEILYEHSREDQILLDLVHVPERDRIRGTYIGVCW